MKERVYGSWAGSQKTESSSGRYSSALTKRFYWKEFIKPAGGKNISFTRIMMPRSKCLRTVYTNALKMNEISVMASWCLNCFFHLGFHANKP